MPLSASKSAGTWAAIFVMSPVILLTPAAPLVACRHDGDFVHFGKRLGHGANHIGHVGEQLVHHRGLVPSLVGFGFHVHGLGFGLALLEDDGGFSFTLRANGCSASLGFSGQTCLLGLGEILEYAAFRFRRP